MFSPTVACFKIKNISTHTFHRTKCALNVAGVLVEWRGMFRFETKVIMLSHTSKLRSCFNIVLNFRPYHTL
jgi:hypothetical protein